MWRKPAIHKQSDYRGSADVHVLNGMVRIVAADGDDKDEMPEVNVEAEDKKAVLVEWVGDEMVHMSKAEFEVEGGRKKQVLHVGVLGVEKGGGDDVSSIRDTAVVHLVGRNEAADAPQANNCLQKVENPKVHRVVVVDDSTRGYIVPRGDEEVDGEGDVVNLIADDQNANWETPV